MRMGNYEVEKDIKTGGTMFLYKPTIKIIDLLNKLANGEKVPKKIKHYDITYIFDKNLQRYYSEIGIELSIYIVFDKNSLNEEAEIIEEDPEDEEIKEHHDIFDYFTGYSFGETNKELLQQLEHNFQIVNEELDYLINKINKD